MMTSRALVTGAGGFVGHHLVAALKRDGWWVRGADVRAPRFAPTAADEFMLLDLRRPEACAEAAGGMTHVFHLAANMGGIGFISRFKAEIVHDNAIMNLSMLQAARRRGVERFLFTSSACVYPMSLQTSADVVPLKEDDCYPADAEDGYGWEKLFGERACRHFREDYGLETRVARLHNVYGPLGDYDGGREKSPAAICRKVALAADGDEIEVWGDGSQTRSYCYVDDCVEGLRRLMASDHREPLNVGSDRLVSIDGLIDIVEGVAGKRVVRRYDPSRPQGVRGRCSDNTTVRRVLGWEPSVPLETGLEATYRWIRDRVASERSALTV